MAKDERRELLWVSFGPGVRISGGSTEAPAAAKSDSISIFKGVVDGDVCAIIEDKSLALPVIVPWHSVGSCSYVPR